MTALQLAELFHDAYERLAPNYGYVTRPETREFRPASPNGQLMIAVCAEILDTAEAREAELRKRLQLSGDALEKLRDDHEALDDDHEVLIAERDKLRREVERLKENSAMLETALHIRDDQYVVALKEIERLNACIEPGTALAVCDALFRETQRLGLSPYSSFHPLSWMVREVERLTEVMRWAQAVLTSLNVGDVASGSPLHLRLREVMIAYREAAEAAKEEA